MTRVARLLTVVFLGSLTGCLQPHAVSRSSLPKPEGNGVPARRRVSGVSLDPNPLIGLASLVPTQRVNLSKPFTIQLPTRTEAAIARAVEKTLTQTPQKVGLDHPPPVRLDYARVTPGPEGTPNRAYIRLAQTYYGIPVEDGQVTVSVQLGQEARVDGMEGQLYQDVAVATPTPCALKSEKDILWKRLGEHAGTPLNDAGIHIRWIEEHWHVIHEFFIPELSLKGGVDHTTHQTYLWDARINFTYSGDVRGRYVEFNPSTTGTNLPNAPIPNLEISDGGSKTWTDSQGNFSLTSFVSPIALGLRGRWADIRSPSPLTITVQSSASQGHWVFNPTGNLDTDTAQVNAYIHVTRVYEWLVSKGLNPPGISLPFPVYVNKEDPNLTCNADFSGSSLDFYVASSRCRNTAFDTPIYHEYGHFLDSSIGGISDLALSEGWGDTIANYLSQQPVVGEGFYLTAYPSYVRSSADSNQYDVTQLKGDIFYDPHINGAAFAGFTWDLRNSLIATLGSTAGIALAENLVLQTLWANSSSVLDAVRAIALRDDTDGNLSNGTPHFAQIQAAAARHGLDAAFDSTAPGAPTGLTASQVNPGSFIAGWTASTDNVKIGGYFIDVALDTSFTQYVALFKSRRISNVTSLTINGLAAGTTYYMRLRAYDTALNNSSYSTSLRVITAADTTPPIAPKTVGLGIIDARNVTLNWEPSTDNVGIDGYLAYLATDISFTNPVIGLNPLFIPAQSSLGMPMGWRESKDISNLQPSTTYFVRLRALDASGNLSAFSTTATALTPAIGQTAPFGINSGGSAYGSADGVFYRPSNTFVSGGNDSVFYTNAPIVGASDPALYQDIRYGDFSYTIPVPAPGNYLVTLKWAELFSSSPQQTVFNVRGEGGSLLQNFDVFSRVLQSKALDLKVPLFIEDSKVDLHFLPVKGYAYVNAIRVDPYNPPDAPPFVEVSGKGMRTLDISWGTPSGGITVAGYRVDIATDAFFSPCIPGWCGKDVGKVNTITATGLPPQIELFIRVRAYDATGHLGAYSVLTEGLTYDDLVAAVNIGGPAYTTTDNRLYQADVGNCQPNSLYQLATPVGGTSDPLLYQNGVVSPSTCSLTIPTHVGLYTGILKFIDTQSTAAGQNICDIYVNGQLAIRGQDVFAKVGRNIAYDITVPVTASNSKFSVTLEPRLGECKLAALALIKNSAAVPVPSNLRVSEVTKYSIAALWDSTFNATHYYVDVSLSMTGPIELSSLENFRDVYMQGLKPGTPYYLRVRAMDSDGNISSPSPWLAVTTLPEGAIPLTPGIASSYATPSAVRLKLIHVEGSLLSAKADISLTPTFSTLISPLMTHYDLVDGTLTIESLQPITNYYIRVRVTDSVGHVSAYSPTLSVLTSNDYTSPEMPSNLSVAASPAALDLTWTVPTDDVSVTSHRLDVATDSLFQNYVPGYQNRQTGPTGHYFISGLAYDTVYYMRVRATDSTGNTSSSSNFISGRTLLQDTIPPHPPALIVISNPTTTTLDGAWYGATDNIGVKVYRVDVSLDPAFGSFEAGYHDYLMGTMNASRFYGLSPGKKYYVRARAYDEAGNVSVYSNSGSGTTLPVVPDTIAPSIPSGLGILAISPTTLYCYWSISTDNQTTPRYRMDLSTSPTFTSFVSPYKSADMGYTFSTNITSLTPATTYYMRVLAYDDAGNLSLYSPTVFGTTKVIDIAPPSVPDLTMSAISSTSLLLAWPASTDNQSIPSYRVDLSTTSLFTSFVSPYSNYSVGHLIEIRPASLVPSTTYYARVRAYDDAGNVSLNSTTRFAVTLPPVDQTPPSVPGNLTILPLSSTTLLVSWIASTDNVSLHGYQIDISVRSDFTSFIPPYQNMALNRITSNSFGSLAPGTTYYVRMRAYDDAGNFSAYTPVGIGVTLPKPPDRTPPSIPTDFYVSAYAPTFYIYWGISDDDVDNSPTYRIDVSSSPTFTSFVPSYRDLLIGSYPRFTITVPRIDTTYYVRVRAFDIAGNASAYSQTVVLPIVLDTTPPSSPNNVTMSAVSSTTLLVGWSTSTDDRGVTGYRFDLSLTSNFSTFVLPYNNYQIANSTTSRLGPLPPGVYYLRVRAYDAAGNVSSNSVTVAASLPLDIILPTPPTLIVISSPAATTLMVTLSGASDNVAVTGCKLDVSLDTAFGTFEAGYHDYLVGLGTPIKLSSLFSGNRHFIRVRCFDAVGNLSNYSYTATALTLFVPDTIAPSVPTHLISTEISSTAAVISWDPSVDNSTGPVRYRIDISTDYYFSTSLPPFNNYQVGVSTSIRISTFVAGVYYYVRVRAYDPAGNTSSNSITGGVQLRAETVPPTPPTRFVISSPTLTTLNVAWFGATDNVGITDYLLEASNSPDFITYSRNITDARASIQLTSLLPATTYYFRVRAFDAARNGSSYSAVASAVTLPKSVDTIPPSIPPNVTMSPLGSTQMLITWSSSTDNFGVAGYRLDVSTNSNFLTFIFYDRLMGSYGNGGQIAVVTGIRYYARLRAYDFSGNVSGNSLTATAVAGTATTGSQSLEPLSLNTPVLRLPAQLPLTAHLRTSSSDPGVLYEWVVEPLSNDNGARSAGAASFSKSLPSNNSLSLSSWALQPGLHRIQVRALDASGHRSAAAQAIVTLVASENLSVSVSPNPWRINRDRGHPVIFRPMTQGCEVQIFTIDGRFVHREVAGGDSIAWDLKNDHGAHIASGIYFYIVTTPDGKKSRGKFVIMR